MLIAYIFKNYIACVASLKGHWCPKWMREIYSLYEDVNILDGVKIGRLRWTGHVTRIEEERTPKKVLNENLHNTRSVGKPRKRWEGVVQIRCIIGPRNTKMKEESWE